MGISQAEVGLFLDYSPELEAFLARRVLSLLKRSTEVTIKKSSKPSEAQASHGRIGFLLIVEPEPLLRLAHVPVRARSVNPTELLLHRPVPWCPKESR